MYTHNKPCIFPHGWGFLRRGFAGADNRRNPDVWGSKHRGGSRGRGWGWRF